jgi:hypothetical protein
MDAANGSQPALGGGEGIAYGVIFGPLTVVRPDRIMVKGQTLYLRDGQTCLYLLGTPMEVVYAEIDERRYIDRITAVRPRCDRLGFVEPSFLLAVLRLLDLEPLERAPAHVG